MPCSSNVIAVEKMTMLNREDLISQYAERLVEGMDIETVVMYAIDQLMEGLRTYTDAELRTEIEDFYPDLLETE
jgi:hypothetical protein